MSDKIKCFWLEPIPHAEVSLRRYRGSKNGLCPKSGFGFHNGETIVVPRLPRPIEKKFDEGEQSDEDYPRTDPRWPKQCPCGRQFEETDHWQVNTRRLHEASGDHDGKIFTIDNAPVGAMWDAWWYSDTYKGPDGKCLVVRTPGGDWIIDSTTKGGGWTRTGDPPELTVQPSIGIGREPGKGWTYHGWLRNGYLVTV